LVDFSQRRRFSKRNGFGMRRNYQTSLKKKGSRPMDFTGRIMRGFVCVDPIGIDSDKDLEYWIQVCLDFNPKAKSSKKSPAAKKPMPTARKAKKLKNF
jgi:hypothetical protein